MMIEKGENELTIQPPAAIADAPGFEIAGKKVKSFIYSTDIATIYSSHADAVFAVYPYTAEKIISRAIIMASPMPVICGVGGRITQGMKSAVVALDAASEGAAGVVVNTGIDNKSIEDIRKLIDIPIVVSVISEQEDIDGRIAAGANILNVAAGERTATVVTAIRKKFSDVTIIASGGPTDESIKRTIEAGATAITYTPPSTKEMIKVLMKVYRTEANEEARENLK